MVNDKDEQWPIGVQLIVLAAFICAIGGLFYIEHDIRMEPYNKVCQDLGFNESTGYDYDNCGGGTTSTTIECDNNYMNYFSSRTACVSRDKWGDCNNYEREYYLVNYSC